MISRGIRILTLPLLKRRENVKALQPVRTKFAFHYRDFPPQCPRWHFFAADALNAFFWWWMFIHCYYQWGHVVGEYDYPEPDKWTDAQLGVVDEFD